MTTEMKTEGQGHLEAAEPRAAMEATDRTKAYGRGESKVEALAVVGPGLAGSMTDSPILASPGRRARAANGRPSRMIARHTRLVWRNMVSSLLGRRSTAVATVALFGAAMAALLAGTAVAAPAFGETTAVSPAQGARISENATRGVYQRPAPRVVKQWAAAWNSGSPEQMADLFTEDGIYEDHAFQAVFQGKAGVAQWVSITTGSIDDVHVEVTGAFRRGNRIAATWTFSGKDTAGGLGGQPPTGKSFSVSAASIFQTKGNKIQRVDDYYSPADLLRQLGLPSGA